MPTRQLHTNFSSGQIGKQLSGRSDLQQYQNGAETVINYRLLPQGGLRRRPGTALCTEVANFPTQHEEFIFAPDQRYQVMFTEAFVDIYWSPPGQNAVLAYRITSPIPYPASAIGYLSVFQSGDYMFVTHNLMRPFQLVRQGLYSFRFEPFAFETQQGLTLPGEIYQPYFNFMPKPLRLTVGFAGPGTWDASRGWKQGDIAMLTCEAAIFDTRYEGYVLEVDGSQFMVNNLIDNYRVGAQLLSQELTHKIANNGLRSIGGERTIWVFDPGHHFVFGQSATIRNGIAFGGLSSTKVNQLNTPIAAVSDLEWSYHYLSEGGDSPPVNTATGGGPNIEVIAPTFTTYAWKEAMYSAVRGWPDCVGMYGSRLVLAGGAQQPNRVNLSKIDAPFNFGVGTGLDDESIQVGVSGKRTPRIRHIVATKHLELFADSAEYYCPLDQDQQALTPKNVNFIEQSTFGSPSYLPARPFDQSTIFFTRQGLNLRQFVFGSNEAGYDSPNLSAMSPELIRNPNWLTVLPESPSQQEAVAYVVNGEGSVSVFSMLRSEKVAGWALWSSQGQFRSSCSVEGDMFFTATRTVTSTEKRFLERLDPGHLLDCSIIQSAGPSPYAAPAFTRWLGFLPLAGTWCDVVVDGVASIGGLYVDGAGGVVVPVPANSIEVGFAFIPRLVTLEPELQLQDGPTFGQPRRIVRVMLKVNQSVDVVIQGNHFEVKPAESDLGLAPDPYSGLIEFWLMGWDRAGQITIDAPVAAPFNLLALSQEIEF